MATAWQFPEAEQLKFDEERRKALADQTFAAYSAGVQARHVWNDQHLKYDQMMRGQVDRFNPRVGPWPGSSNTHLQLPQWLIDAVNTRLVQFIFNQVPLVQGIWEEPSDQKVAGRAAKLVGWDLQERRMNARAHWSRVSKIRCGHGVGVGYVTYAHSQYSVRVFGQEKEAEVQKNRDGTPKTDASGMPVLKAPGREIRKEKRTRYQGPVIEVMEWDDVVVPIGCMNLQPNGPDNPRGATEVDLRFWEPLSLMKKKAAEGSYYLMFADTPDGETVRDDKWWRDKRPAQDRSGGLPPNQERERQQDTAEGVSRGAATVPKSYDAEYRAGRAGDDPSFEIVVRFCPIEIDGEMEEAILFTCLQPRHLLGAYRLSDVVWSGRRPLFDLHYWPVSNRFYSMGICELAQRISEELDTIHNMRVDVGFATNMPFFLYRSTSNFNPDEITIRPFKGIAVSNPNEIVFPNLQGKDTFYYQEETLLLSYVERLFGITDLFLGVTPTRGAAARTATGFVGTQQEGLARLSEIASQDAEAFSTLCNLVYDLEIQYGPQERVFRLTGEESDQQRMTRDDLWFQGTYDFRLGANIGLYSQYSQIQASQAIFQVGAVSPLTNMHPARRWALEARVYRAHRLSDAEIEEIIGPKAAAGGEAKSQEVENNEMAAFKYGPGQAAPTHPDDNDLDHIQRLIAFVQNDTFAALGQPNYPAFEAHLQMHTMQMAQKRQMATQSAQGVGGGPGQMQPPENQPANAMNRARSQVDNVTPPAGTLMQQQTQQGRNGAPPPPFLVGRGQ